MVPMEDIERQRHVKRGDLLFTAYDSLFVRKINNKCVHYEHYELPINSCCIVLAIDKSPHHSVTHNLEAIVLTSYGIGRIDLDCFYGIR